MDRFDELLKCIANYNKQFSDYAKKYFNSNNQNERLEYFNRMHKKHYYNELNKLLITNFDIRNINYIEMCLLLCFKFPFDNQFDKICYNKYKLVVKPDNVMLDNLLLESQNEFYNDMINNSYEYTKKLAKLQENILSLAIWQLNGFSNEQYDLFKKCIEQFNNLEY